MRQKFPQTLSLFNSTTKQKQSDNYPINFLWVGPPKKENETILCGHDVADPIAVAKQINNQGGSSEELVYFWCLTKHCKYYEEFFSKRRVKINVVGIETHLLAVANRDDNSASCSAAKKILNYMGTDTEENQKICGTPTCVL